MKQRIDTEAEPRTDRAEDQPPSRVLAEDEVRIAHRVGKRNADPGACRRADQGAVQQTITRLRVGLALAERQRSEDDTHHRKAAYA
jgi:hypothetical protein